MSKQLFVCHSMRDLLPAAFLSMCCWRDNLRVLSGLGLIVGQSRTKEITVIVICVHYILTNMEIR